MYGNKLTSEYGRTEGRHRDVIGRIETAPIGNLILNPGRMLAPEGATEPQGWEPTGHVVMRPSEGFAFVAEVVETMMGHENNRDDLLPRTQSELHEVELIVEQLKGLAGEFEVAEAEAGRNEEVV